MNLENETEQPVSDLSLADQLASALGPSDTAPVAEEAPQEAPAAETPQSPSEPEVPDELALLKRVIASDPNLSAQYEAAKYGVPYTPPQAPSAPTQQTVPQPQPQQQAQPFDPNQLFGEEGFDPYNPQHHALLQQQIVRSEIAPLQNAIAQIEQARVQAEQMQFQQQVEEAETGLAKQVDAYLPGFSDIYGKYRQGDPQLGAKERVIAGAIETEVVNVLRSYPQHLQMNPIVHKEALAKVAPFIRQLSSELGLTTPQQQANNAKATAATKEIYVEGSGAIPAPSESRFKQAEKRGDLSAMLAAALAG